MSRAKYDQFERLCGETLIKLQQYKLKTNLCGCNMKEPDFLTYYNYYNDRCEKRLQDSFDKIVELIKVFEKNYNYLKGLELRTLNNLFFNYRVKMDLVANEPTDFNYVKFQAEEEDLLEAIILQDLTAIDKIKDLAIKIKLADEKASPGVFIQLNQNPGLPKFEKAIRTISWAECRYSKYYEKFERSVANMINQLHGHFNNLSQFYSLWQNLGSSMIYQLRSDRQIIIDKQIMLKESYGLFNEKEDEIRYMLQILPNNSRLRRIYQDKLSSLLKRQEEQENNQYMYKANPSKNSRNTKKSMKQKCMINIVDWFETSNNIKKQLEDHQSLVLEEKEDGFFRYTFEELHYETLELLEQIKGKKLKNSNEKQFNRFYYYVEDLEEEKKTTTFNLTKHNVPPQMSLNCWYDRSGPKGYFTILDFPANLFQRTIQFELDRNAELIQMDLKVKKQYNVKEKMGGSIEFEQKANLGYKYTCPYEELEYLKTEVSSRYDPEYLPEPKIKKQSKAIQEEDFSDSDNSEKCQKQQQQKKEESKAPQTKTEKQVTPDKISSETTANDDIFYDQVSKKLLENFKQPEHVQQNLISEDKRWIKTKQKIRNDFQNFIKIFLPRQQLIMQKKNTKLVQPIEFKYLQACRITILEETVNKEELGTTILINQRFYVKVEPRYLKNRVNRVKVKLIALLDEVSRQTIEKQLLEFFSIYGACLFQQIYEDGWDKIEDENKEAFIIGCILKEMKQIYDREAKDEKQKIPDFIKSGKQTLKQFKQYYQKFDK